MALAIEYELGSVAGTPVPELVAARSAKYRSLGAG
jgi:acyl-CoA carboxylase subunit beta